MSSNRVTIVTILAVAVGIVLGSVLFSDSVTVSSIATDASYTDPDTSTFQYPETSEEPASSTPDATSSPVVAHTPTTVPGEIEASTPLATVQATPKATPTAIVTQVPPSSTPLSTTIAPTQTPTYTPTPTSTFISTSIPTSFPTSVPTLTPTYTSTQSPASSATPTGVPPQLTPIAAATPIVTGTQLVTEPDIIHDESIPTPPAILDVPKSQEESEDTLDELITKCQDRFSNVLDNMEASTVTILSSRFDALALLAGLRENGSEENTVSDLGVPIDQRNYNNNTYEILVTIDSEGSHFLDQTVLQYSIREGTHVIEHAVRKKDKIFGNIGYDFLARYQINDDCSQIFTTRSLVTNNLRGELDIVTEESETLFGSEQVSMFVRSSFEVDSNTVPVCRIENAVGTCSQEAANLIFRINVGQAMAGVIERYGVESFYLFSPNE